MLLLVNIRAYVQGALQRVPILDSPRFFCTLPNTTCSFVSYQIGLNFSRGFLIAFDNPLVLTKVTFWPNYQKSNVSPKSISVIFSIFFSLQKQKN